MTINEHNPGASDFLFSKSQLDAFLKPKVKFQRVQKRDGSIVDFDKTKIASVIFAAAQSVGGKDRELSEQIADRVIIYLDQNYEDQLLTVEQIQDAVEKVLIENGHARTVKAFILYREQRARIRRLKSGTAPADIESSFQLLETNQTDQVKVQTSQDKILSWNRQRIVDALIREAKLNIHAAQVIAIEVETQIIYSKIKTVTVGLIRELVNAKLLEFGLIQEHRLHARLGIPVFDLEQKLTNPRFPAGYLEQFISEHICHQYQLERVYSSEVVSAHTRGDIQLENLGSMTTLVRGSIPVDLLVQKGMAFPNQQSFLKPPQDLPAFFNWIIQAGHTWQNYFSQSMDWRGFDTAIDRYSESMSQYACQQSLQPFLQQFENLCGKTQHRFHFQLTKDMSASAFELLSTFIDVYLDGDTLGNPFKSLIPVLHMDSNTEGMQIPSRWIRLLEKLQTEHGTHQLSFHQPSAPFHPLTCNQVTMDINKVVGTRRLDDPGMNESLKQTLELAFQAHQQKKRFLEQLLASQKQGPFADLLPLWGNSPGLQNSNSMFIIKLSGFDTLPGMISVPNSENPGDFTTALKRWIDLIHSLKEPLCWKYGINLQIEFVLPELYRSPWKERWGDDSTISSSHLSGWQEISNIQKLLGEDNTLIVNQIDSATIQSIFKNNIPLRLSVLKANR